MNIGIHLMSKQQKLILSKTNVTPVRLQFTSTSTNKVLSTLYTHFQRYPSEHY